MLRHRISREPLTRVVAPTIDCMRPPSAPLNVALATRQCLNLTSRPASLGFSTSASYNLKRRRTRSQKLNRKDEASLEDTAADVKTTSAPESTNEPEKNWLNASGAGAWSSLAASLQAASTEVNPSQSQENTQNHLATKEALTQRIQQQIQQQAQQQFQQPWLKATGSHIKKNKGLENARWRRRRESRKWPAIDAGQLKLEPLQEDAKLDIPSLQYNLDRVLFNPGPYHLQDPRSRVYNFDPYLATIMPVHEFDFDAIKGFVTSSKDKKLREMAAREGIKYCGSTSSMTGLLSQLHFLLSSWRLPEFRYISRQLIPESDNYTLITRVPAAAFVHHHDGFYAIDSDKEHDTDTVLSSLGQSMERLLTLPKEQFEKYRRSKSHMITEEEKNSQEAYHYTKLGDFLMRSQLDAKDPRVPGTGVFDLKTRAVLAVRMSSQAPESGAGYEIRERVGQWESFEREYYDMVRSAFLKYSLQVRMGRMDGIFVAFHNTQRIFGFQYISLQEMDEAIHGTSCTEYGDAEFKTSITLLNELLNRATKRFPGKTLRIHLEAQTGRACFFAEPVSDKAMEDIQQRANKAFESKAKQLVGRNNADTSATGAEAAEARTEPRKSALDLLNRGMEGGGSLTTAQNDTWLNLVAKVKEMLNERHGISLVSAAAKLALRQDESLVGSLPVEREYHLETLVEALTMAARGNESSAEEMPGNDIKPADEPAEPAESEFFESEVVNGAADGSETAESGVADLSMEEADAEADEIDMAEFERGFRADIESLADLISQMNSVANEPAQPGTPDIDAKADADKKVDAETKTETEGERMGLIVHVLHEFDGEIVERPEFPKTADASMKAKGWKVRYKIEDMGASDLETTYGLLKKKRKAVLGFSDSPDSRRHFVKNLQQLSEEGKKFREKRTKEEEGKPVYGAWDKDPLSLE
ncbi:mitochondrial protein Pet127-domain-containing protein [Stachybotrys elegans]|uniref:Mitochondrial protein Pet127-domain-containing protein n=1 Tax=Stachybotrys elegans TaxID=80388 RepID=A0A8K0SQ13_9HYPO|nr:mitochondrial protein Pet127-domain-containing protein [Stachybotrys elegans]